ncbi:MAG: TraR/DksA family transcriptional regulator [Gammaproteobacteria bacterium]|nr:MAG: TraR/DksA family transcriptional regulator [Gammaproteobacteria bacterium]
MSPPAHDDARRALHERLEELDALDAAGADAQKTVELDQSRVGRLSRMDALQGQAMAGASAARRQHERRRIRAALLRLDEGHYGRCLECDAPIVPGRLEIDPAAERCVHCAR